VVFNYENHTLVDVLSGTFLKRTLIDCVDNGVTRKPENVRGNNSRLLRISELE
jgi:hypothetical protein